MNYQKFLAKSSNYVVDQILPLLSIPSDLPQGTHSIKPSSLSDHDLFWKYHDLFPIEFVKALSSSLLPHYSFISYDHLQNNLVVSVASAS